MGTASRLPELIVSLTNHGLGATVQIPDVGKVVESQARERMQRASTKMDWTNYHDYDEVSDDVHVFIIQTISPQLCIWVRCRHITYKLLPSKLSTNSLTLYPFPPQINAWMSSLVADHPDLCSLEHVGTSYEGRVMNLLTVGSGGADKPGIFIDGGRTGSSRFFTLACFVVQ